MADGAQRKAINKTLRETFGYTRLRAGQQEVIASVLKGQDTLAVMPTGAGKSLCYQLPSLHLPGTTVIVSPLISLMKDQVDKLEKAGLEAAQLNSALTTQEHEENLEQIKTEQSDFIFVMPERFTDRDFLEDLRKRTINFVVIDEAHFNIEKYLLLQPCRTGKHCECRKGARRFCPDRQSAAAYFQERM